MPLLEVALNGHRTAAEHPAVPYTPEEIAREARASVDAGGQVLHIHAYGEDGRETLEAAPGAAMLRAVRHACSGVPISGTTAAYLEPDPEQRLALVSKWTELPDLVTANQGEEGIAELCEHLLERGIGIEAGLLEVVDAEAFVESRIANRCTRVLVEPLDADPDAAMAHAAAIEDVLSRAGISVEQVHHGDMIASWAVSERGARRGHGIRTGIEDTTLLQDGTLAPDNATLVRAAVQLLVS